MTLSSPKMATFDSTLLHSLWAYGWFARIISTEEDRVTVVCEMFSRDYDEETGVTDILMVDVSEHTLVTRLCNGLLQQMYVADGDERVCVVCKSAHNDNMNRSFNPLTCMLCPAGCGRSTRPHALRSVAKFHGIFELRQDGPAVLVDQPLPASWGFKQMLPEMVEAIGAALPGAEAACPARSSFILGRSYERPYPVDLDIDYEEPDEDEAPEPNFDDMAPPAPSSALDEEDAQAEADRPAAGTWPCYADASWGRCSCCYANLEELDKLYGTLDAAVETSY